jgi:hypothetical protein
MLLQCAILILIVIIMLMKWGIITQPHSLCHVDKQWPAGGVFV